MPRADAMRDSVWQTLAEKIALQKENAELKRLLGFAIDDLYWLQVCSTCKGCDNENGPPCERGCLYEWRYASDAEKLLKQRRKDELKGDE